MSDWNRLIRRYLACLAFGVLGLGALSAHANTYGDSCAGCHATAVTVPPSPPNMPSQNATYGKIMAQNNAFDHFTDTCINASALYDCVLRRKMKGIDAGGTLVNTTAQANMSGLAATFSNAELEAVRLYLLKARDLVTGSPSNAFSFPSTLTTANSSISSTVQVDNWRGAAIGFNYTITGANSGDFSVTAGGTGSCAATASWLTATTCSPSFTVRFSPSAGGSRTATLNLNFTAGAGDAVPFTRTFSMTGTGVVPAPGFSISTNTLTFSAKLGASANGSVTITNPGGATANLVLGALTYSSARYVRALSSTCSTGTSLAPGGSCVLTTTFSPNAAGAQNGTLSIAHNAVGSPATVALNGTGTQALINPTASTLAFGSVQLGVPKPLGQAVANTGDASLVFSVDPSAAAALTGAGGTDYVVSGNCQAATPLAVGATCNLVVTFTPSVLGSRPATLTISSDATNGPLVIGLSGTGVALPEPVVTFPATDFPDTVIGETSSATRSITIRNDRTRDIGYTITAATDFTIASETCPTRVVTGGGTTCTILVRFAPTLGAGEGRRQGTYALSFTGTSGDAAPGSVSGVVAGTALLPLNQSATVLDASAVVGTSSTVSLLLTNRSITSLTLSTVVFAGATPADFARDPASTCAAGGAIGPSASCTLTIRFTPGAAGTRNATLTVTHTAPGSPVVVQLHGTATPAPQGRISLGAALLTYADTQLGASSPQSVTVVNTGDLALDFGAFTVGGSAAAEFTRGGSCAVGTPLAIGASCVVTMTFSPTVLGLRTATLTIASNASNGTAVLALSGNGVPVPAPVATLAPGTLDFGNQTTGGLYPTRQVRLTNSGTADLAITGIAISGAGFTGVSSGCPAVLAPSASCTIDVAFVATAATAYSGAVTVGSNAAGSPTIAVLRGTGVAAALPVLVFAPVATNLDFGNVSAGSVSALQTVTVQNQGPGGVTLTVLNAIGPGASSFSVVGGTCALGTPLFQGNSCTIDVRFAPGSAGLKTANVQIASTGSFPPVLTLTGVGLAGPNPSLTLSVTSLAFDKTRIGAQSMPAAVRLTSSGSGVVTVSAMTVSGAYGIQSTTCPAMPFTLPAGSECTVSVSFVPTAEGASTGTLRVTSDAAPALRDVALNGSAEQPVETSSGGCTIGGDPSSPDPVLWLLLAVAVGMLLRRRLKKGCAP